MFYRAPADRITHEISSQNFKAFIWHATFLAVAKNFMDVDTVIPAMLIKAGGGPWHIGLLTAIMVGLSKFSQLLFAPLVSTSHAKKNHLLAGINLRIFSLFGMAVLFYLYFSLDSSYVILIIFGLVSVFSISGAYANIAFTDILGKSIQQDKRKRFFSLRQVISSLGMLASAIATSYVLTLGQWPHNYFTVFLLAGLFLLIASMGFWRISEILSPDSKPSRFGFAHLWIELKANRKLLYYLLSINILGLGQGLMPFILLYAGHHGFNSSHYTGHFLIAKTLGLIISGLYLFYRSNSISYNRMLIVLWVISLAYPLWAWVFGGTIQFYYISFFLGGIFLTLYQVTNSGVLLEISTVQNRALYTGIAGAGNILPVAFPLLGGSIISTIGFNGFFGLYAVITLGGLYTVYKLDCNK